MKKAGWKVWPEGGNDIRNHLKYLDEKTREDVIKDFRKLFVDNPNFRGQDYKVDPRCKCVVRPGAAIFFHSFHYVCC